MKLLWIAIYTLLIIQGTDNIKNVENALRAGSAKELIKYCNETVELKIDGKSSNYSSNQAEVVLRSFFQQNPVVGFSYIHQGSDQGLKYSIGKYSMEEGSYRVVLFFKKMNGRYAVDTLNFSKE